MRSYNEYCGVAAALDLVGQRWALLLVRELLPGPRRFTDLLLPGLSPNVLATRLHELASAGLIVAVSLPAPARDAWALTEAGRRLEPVVLALGAFGASYLSARRPTQAVSARWLVVSLQRRYAGSLGGVSIQLTVDDAPYVLRFASGRLVVHDGVAHDPDLTLEGSFRAVASVLGPRPSKGPALTVSGDAQIFEALLQGLRTPSP